MLQETRNYKWPQNSSYNAIQKQRNENTGGGLVTGADKQFALRDISDIIPESLQQEESGIELILAQVCHPLCELLLLNIYIPYQKKFKSNNRKILSEWINQLVQNRQTLLIVAGDFNQTDQPLAQLHNIGDNLQPTLIASRNKKLNKVDWLLTQQKIDATVTIQFHEQVSDHAIIIAEISANITQKQQQVLKIPYKEGAKMICKISESKANSIEEFVYYFKKFKKLIKHIKIIRIKIKPREKQQKSIQDFINITQKFIRTSQSNKAYKILKRLTIINPDKREGGLMQCFLNENDKIISSKEEVIKNCLQHLEKLSGKTHYDKLQQSSYLQNLNKINETEIKQMQAAINKEKAITLSGFSLDFFKDCKKSYLLNDWWKKEFIMELYDQIFSARLIPLNKVWPQIPKPNEFRPITVTSPMYRWLECRFAPKIAEYMQYTLDKNQTGFVNSCGTNINIRLLIEKIQSTKKRDGLCAMFIDLRSAYNTVNREKLFQIIQKKQIFNVNELNFLFYLQNHIFYQTMDERVYLKNGLAQGSVLSPGLFNIYFEEVIEELRKRSNMIFWYKKYADDLVIIIQFEQLQPLINWMRIVFNSYSLIINNDKSAIIPLKQFQINSFLDEGCYCGIPVRDRYKFLGVIIDGNGSIIYHLEKLEKRINYLNQSFYFKNKLSFANKILLWNIFNKPNFEYISYISKTQQIYIQNKIKRLWWKSIKKFLQLPKTTPNKILNCCFEDYLKMQDRNDQINKQKINARFGIEIFKLNQEIYDQNQKIEMMSNLIIPNNICQLFYLYKNKCKCCNLNLNVTQVCKHLKIKEEDLISQFQFKKIKKIKNLQTKNERNQKMVDEMIEKINKII